MLQYLLKYEQMSTKINSFLMQQTTNLNAGLRSPFSQILESVVLGMRIAVYESSMSRAKQWKIT